jgi:hypothetical protein
MATALQPPVKTAKSERNLRQRSFRCIVYRLPKLNLYLAECIDLDIIVQAKTQEAAMVGLRNAISGHVQVAVEMREAHLLNRPSPITHRLRYHFAGFQNAVKTYRELMPAPLSPSQQPG